MKVEIDLNKTPESNASSYYEKIKRLKKKLEGTKDALSDSLTKLKKIHQEKDKVIKELKAKQKKQDIKKEYYGKFFK